MTLFPSSSPLKIYKADNGQAVVEISAFENGVRLSIEQIAILLDCDVAEIKKHTNDISMVDSLDNAAVTQSFQLSSQHNHYDLDLVISIAYRVESKKAMQFRQWANRILKEHLLKGYTINEQQLMQQGTSDVHQALDLLRRTLSHKELEIEIGQEAITLIKEYARSWTLLLKYDDDELDLPTTHHTPYNILSYHVAKAAIDHLKQGLMEKNEAAPIFGQEKAQELVGILGNIEQTFDGVALYPSAEERAAHLLYFVIKDHPFNDGNKRIGCLLFLLYLHLNGLTSRKLTDSALVALALLVAESNPKEKNLIIRLIINLITE
jgi:prophage maintenance system killer protein